MDRDGQEILPPCRVEHLNLEDWLGKHLLPSDRVVIESTTNAWHVYDLLEPLVAEVLVANPIKVKQIARALQVADGFGVKAMLPYDMVAVASQDRASAVVLSDLPQER